MNSEPDWKYWNQMPTAMIWECVCLSLDADPRFATEFGMAKAMGTVAKINEYEDRLSIAEKHVVHKIGEPGLYTRDVYTTFEFWKINIPQFVAWLKHLDRSLPPELTGYSPPTEPAAVTPKKAEAIEARATPQQARERDNLIRIIGGMLSAFTGNNGLAQHPTYPTQAKLIKALGEKMDDGEAFSKSNLEKVFSKANQSLKQ